MFLHFNYIAHLAEKPTLEKKPEENKCRVLQERNKYNICNQDKTVYDQPSTSTGMPFSGDTICYTEDDLLGEGETQQSNTCHLENEMVSVITENFEVCNICGILVHDLNEHVDNEHERQIKKGNYIFCHLSP